MNLSNTTPLLSEDHRANNNFSLRIYPSLLNTSISGTLSALTDSLLMNTSTSNTNMALNESKWNSSAAPTIPNAVSDDVLLNGSTAAAGQAQADSLGKAAHIINMYIRPAILIIGFFNNILTCCVMRRPRLKLLSVSVYFSALAVSDNFVITIDFVFNVLSQFFFNFRNHSSEICRQYHFWLPVFFTYSSWLVVCIAVERVLVVKYPFRAKSLCNTRNALITVAAVFLLIFAISWYHYPKWVVNEEGICSLNSSYLTFSMYVSPWLMSSLYSYLPFLILLFTNGLLLSRLFAADKNREMMTKSTEGNKMADKLTKTAISICVTYLLLTTPVSVYYTLTFANYTNKSAGFKLAGAITDTLGLVNYAINMFLYIITSRLFRRELQSMLTCWKCERMQANPATYSNTLS